MRLILAILAAASVPPLMINIYFLLERLDNSSEIFADSYFWSGILFKFTVLLVFSAGYVLLLGVPTYLLLRKFNYFRWRPMMFSGAVFGAIPAAKVTLPLQYSVIPPHALVVLSQEKWTEFFYVVSFCAVCGAMAALAFWLVVPKKSSETPPAAGINPPRVLRRLIGERNARKGVEMSSSDNQE
tara:strand:- start:1765 stop:2316 length:552 start_codon:yes stop_codon:yes gene_type:complete